VWWDSATHPQALIAAANTFRHEQPDLLLTLPHAPSTGPQRVISRSQSATGMKSYLE
jgi:hypothetical protein